MSDVVERARSWAAAGRPGAVATVTATKRSAPLPPGSKMAVSPSGEIAGAVSGGCVEGAVVVESEAVLSGGPPRLLRFGIADEEAWDVGLPCGGEIDVWVERWEGPADPRHPGGPAEDAGALRADHDTLARIAAAGGRGALATVVEVPGHGAIDATSAGRMGTSEEATTAAPPTTDRLGARLLVTPDAGVRGTLGDRRLDEAAVDAAERLLWEERSERIEVGEVGVFIDVVHPAPRIVVVGAVDFTRALVRVAAAAGWRSAVVDPRGRFAVPERFPEAERVVAAWPAEGFEALGGLGHSDSVCVLTHDPKLDDAALRVALPSGARYVGAMGSRRAQARRRERLLAAGLDPELLERLAAPIGHDLGALNAEETALSIMAEVVAVRHGRRGGPLAAARGRIHEVGT